MYAIRYSIFFFCFLLSGLTFAQPEEAEEKNDLNFGFEKQSPDSPLPDGWFRYTPAYIIKRDSVEKHSGRYSLSIESVPGKQTAMFGGASTFIPATTYEGKELELKLFLKLKDVKNGAANAFLRMQNEGSELLYSGDLLHQNIQGSSDWVSYSIKAKYPKGVSKIIIGILLGGEGKLWVDDVHLFIDNREIVNTAIKYKGGDDKEFDQGSGVTTIDLTPSRTDDLALLGKMWGFLKYYHPEVRNGNYNWDYELFRILPRLLAASNQTERNEVLANWIAKLGAVEKGKAQNLDNKENKLKPDLDWFNTSGLDPKLVEQLNNIKNTKRTEENCYAGKLPVGNPLFKNEPAYLTMKEDDAGMRLLSLFRYWNMIHYYFPYKYLIEENWNEVLKEFIPVFLNAKDKLQYKKAVLELIARIHDSHAGMSSRDSIMRSYFGALQVPVYITFMDNKAVVTGHIGPPAVTGLKPGDIIEKINDRSVADLVKERMPTASGSNPTAQLRYIANFLLRTNEKEVTLIYLRNGQQGSEKVRTVSVEAVLKIMEETKKDTCFKWLQPDIAYLFPGNLTNEMATQIMPQVEHAKGLIVDLRCYPREFVVYTLCNYLYPKRKAFAKFTYCSMITPGCFSFFPEAMAGQKNANAFKGKLIILVNEETISQAEFTTMALRAVPGAVVIGSTTLAADGDVSTVLLPGGIHSWISGIGVYHANGEETQGVGIVPDIQLRPGVKDIQEGRDVLLEKAVEVIRKN